MIIGTCLKYALMGSALAAYAEGKEHETKTGLRKLNKKHHRGYVPNLPSKPTETPTFYPTMTPTGNPVEIPPIEQDPTKSPSWNGKARTCNSAQKQLHTLMITHNRNRRFVGRRFSRS